MKILLTTKFDYNAEEVQKIAKLRKLVESDSSLEIGTEDILLSKFLNFAQWSVENALKAIHRYYDFKLEHPNWVAHHPVDYFREHFYFTLSKFIMPKPDKDGRLIVVTKTVDAFKKFPDYLYDMIEMDDLIFESLLLLPQAQKYGITIISDLSGTNKHFLRLASPSMARMINAKNDILPFTSRNVHIIQRSRMMNTASNLMLSFTSKEFKERLHIHDGKNYDKLRAMVGYDSLPAEYGGPEENQLDVNIMYEHLLKHAPYLLKLQSYHKKCPK